MKILICFIVLTIWTSESLSQSVKCRQQTLCSSMKQMTCSIRKLTTFEETATYGVDELSTIWPSSPICFNTHVRKRSSLGEYGFQLEWKGPQDGSLHYLQGFRLDVSSPVGFYPLATYMVNLKDNIYIFQNESIFETTTNATYSLFCEYYGSNSLDVAIWSLPSPRSTSALGTYYCKSKVLINPDTTLSDRPSTMSMSTSSTEFENTHPDHPAKPTQKTPQSSRHQDNQTQNHTTNRKTSTRTTKNIINENTNSDHPAKPTHTTHLASRHQGNRTPTHLTNSKPPTQTTKNTLNNDRENSQQAGPGVLSSVTDKQTSQFKNIIIYILTGTLSCILLLVVIILAFRKRGIKPPQRSSSSAQPLETEEAIKEEECNTVRKGILKKPSVTFLGIDDVCNQAEAVEKIPAVDGLTFYPDQEAEMTDEEIEEAMYEINFGKWI